MLNSILTTLKSINKRRLKKRQARKIEDRKKEINADFLITTPPHCAYIAKCLHDALKKIGKTSLINIGSAHFISPGEKNIVICPQIYDDLPDGYIAYQLEQTGSSLWFTADYKEKLRKSSAILDYSSENIKYLSEEESFSKKLIYCPIPLNPQSTPNSEKKYDVAFYGNTTGSNRRIEYLSAIKSEFKTLDIHGLHGTDLISQLASARIVVNIHFYENALLETTRILECLAHGFSVISEQARDQPDHKELDGLVTFVPVGDIKAMIDVIRQQIKFPHHEEPATAHSSLSCNRSFNLAIHKIAKTNQG